MLLATWLAASSAAQLPVPALDADSERPETARAVEPETWTFPGGLSVAVKPHGLHAEVRDHARTFQVDIAARGIVRESTTAAAPIAQVAEWHRALPDGLEQGWTIAARPSGDAGAPLWLLLDVSGDLAPSPREDGRSAWLLDSNAQLRLVYKDLRVWDAAGRELDARLAAGPRGFGVRVVDRDATYPLTIDPTLAGPAWTFDGDELGAHLGAVVATAGDVNKDGYSDLLVTASLHDDPGVGINAGRAYLFLGSASGYGASPAWTYTGTQASELLGWGGGPAGDVNGDGYDDVVLGSPYKNTAVGAETGAVYVFYGSASGLPATPSWSYTPTSIGGQHFGHACSTAGDVNGDGYADIVVGAPLYSNGEFQEGAVYVFLGSATGLAATPSWMREENEALAFLGYSVSTAGSMDGDSFAEIAAGAYGSGTGESGAVFIYRGSASGLQTPGTLLVGPVGGDAQFGFSVAPAGDWNGDGFADLVVGSRGYDVTPGGNQGRVTVFFGGLYAGGAVAQATDRKDVDGAQSQGTLGTCVAPAGDVNGDGLADVLVGEDQIGAGNPGQANVLCGDSLSPPATTFDAFGTQVGDSFGAALGTAGDANGDGFSEVVIGSPMFDTGAGVDAGRVQVYYGQPKTTPTAQAPTALSGTAGARSGSALALGDADGDGIADLLVGEPDYSVGATNGGRVLLFHGSATGFAASPAFTSATGAFGSKLGSSVAFLGDVDDDGYGDFLVGAPLASDPEASEGKVFLYRGKSSPPFGLLPPEEIQFDVAGALLGSAVAAAGDVDGDGLADAVVGAPGTNASTGAARILNGRKSAPHLVATTLLAGTAVGEKFGAAVCGAGDLNADGFSDVAIGSPEFTNGQSLEGRVSVYSGGPNGIVSTVNTVVESNESNALFGSAVSSAGDITGDSHADLLIGAPGYLAATKGGFVFVHAGLSGANILSATPLHSIHFSDPNADTGAAVAAIGDVNGDGFADVAIGAPRHDAPSVTDSGAMAVFLGSGTVLLGASTLPPSSAAASVPAQYLEPSGATNNGFAGAALAGAADALGSGFGDVAIGAPGSGAGESLVYHGPAGTSGVRADPRQRQFNDGYELGLLGTSTLTDSMGLSLQAGTLYGGTTASLHPGTMAGAAMVRLAWETEELGTVFSSSSTLATATTWTSTGPVLSSPQRLFQAVTGLNGQRNYHWRARLDLQNPFFPHTRWMTLQGNSLQEKKLGTAKDCNHNNVPDSVDIATGHSLDCESDLVPDECEVPPIGSRYPDCNGDLVPDSCEVPPLCPSCFDCNHNGIPDDAVCEVDCNGNSVPDDCEIAMGTEQDTNLDGIPDSCQPQAALFCPGDGVSPHTNCPCSNVSPAGAAVGCLNSLGQGGRLRTSGVARVAFDDFTLIGDQMPSSSALYFQGTAPVASSNGVPFGDGLRCAGGSIVRLGTKINAGGASQYPTSGNPSISVRGQVTVGGTRYYQCWYRNAASFCTAATYNLTNGVSVTWIP